MALANKRTFESDLPAHREISVISLLVASSTLSRVRLASVDPALGRTDKALSIATGSCAMLQTLAGARSYTKKRGSRPARGGIAEVVTTMHIFDLTRISRCRCTAHDRTRWVSVCARWYYS